jgi:hypothetical protein
MDAEPFQARALAADQVDSRGRHPERVCDRDSGSLGRAPVDRRRRHTNAQRVAVPARDLGPPGAREDVDVEEDGVPVRL